MVRYNNLKILLNAGEAKPGGVLGATLSPYLFSANMSDFCKKFNENTKDYVGGFPLVVLIKCDVVEKTYSFFIKKPILIVLYDSIRRAYEHGEFIRFDLLLLYDIICLISYFYGFTLYRAARLLFSYMVHCHYYIMVDFSLVLNKY